MALPLLVNSEEWMEEGSLVSADILQCAELWISFLPPTQDTLHRIMSVSSHVLRTPDLFMVILVHVACAVLYIGQQSV